MSVNGRRILMVMSVPCTTTPLYWPLSLNGPLYLSPARKNVVWYVGPSGSSAIANERLTAYATSSALTGVPSSYFRPSRSVKVHDLLSSDGRPRSVAMSGISCMSLESASYAYCVSERSTRSDRIAVESTKYACVGSRVDGTWLVSTVKVPPWAASHGPATGAFASAFLNAPERPPSPARRPAAAHSPAPPPPQVLGDILQATARAGGGVLQV